MSAEGRQGHLKKPQLMPSDNSIPAQAQREQPLLLSQLPAPFKSEFLHASCSPLECHWILEIPSSLGKATREGEGILRSGVVSPFWGKRNASTCLSTKWTWQQPSFMWATFLTCKSVLRLIVALCLGYRILPFLLFFCAVRFTLPQKPLVSVIHLLSFLTEFEVHSRNPGSFRLNSPFIDFPENPLSPLFLPSQRGKELATSMWHQIVGLSQQMGNVHPQVLCLVPGSQEQ